MKANSFTRIGGLGVGPFLPCAACRTVLEPILGMLLTLGLVITLALQ